MGSNGSLSFPTMAGLPGKCGFFGVFNIVGGGLLSDRPEWMSVRLTAIARKKQNSRSLRDFGSYRGQMTAGSLCLAGECRLGCIQHAWVGRTFRQAIQQFPRLSGSDLFQDLDGPQFADYFDVALLH